MRREGGGRHGSLLAPNKGGGDSRGYCAQREREREGGREGGSEGGRECMGGGCVWVVVEECLLANNEKMSVGRYNTLCIAPCEWYFVERGNIADKLKPKNINISFKNNSNVAIDLFVFIFYCDQTVIDVETGIVIKEFCRASCSTELRSKKNNMVLIT